MSQSSGKRPTPSSTPQGQTPPAQAGQKSPWLWNVILLDDQDHTYDYVIRMMQTVFGHGRDKADQLAVEVDQQGRAICLTAHKELAELKCEQVLAFGRDPLVPKSKGAMQAIIEPAEGESGSGKP